jgi:hypothetical protein
MNKIPYKSLVGCLIYLSICTRPDISIIVGVLSRFCSNPGKTHWQAALRVLKYLKGTQTLGITYKQGTNMVDWLFRQ